MDAVSDELVEDVGEEEVLTSIGSQSNGRGFLAHGGGGGAPMLLGDTFPAEQTSTEAVEQVTKPRGRRKAKR